MIPEELDDGFTTELAPEVYARRMLWAQREKWKTLAVPEAKRQVLEGSYRYGAGEIAPVELISFICTYTSEEEQKDFQDLADSIQVHVKFNPRLSLLDCGLCRSFAVDFDRGEVLVGADGKLTPIPGGALVPCETRRGCLKRHHTDPLGLSNVRWAKTWAHYWRYRDNQSSLLYNDPIVLRNRLLLNWIVDYGRDCRFDPFIGRSSGRRSSDDEAKGDAGPNRHGASSYTGIDSRGAGGSSCIRQTVRHGVRDSDDDSSEPDGEYQLG